MEWGLSTGEMAREAARCANRSLQFKINRIRNALILRTRVGEAAAATQRSTAMRGKSGIVMGRLHHGRISRGCAKSEGRDQARLLRERETRDRREIRSHEANPTCEKTKSYNGVIVGDKSKAGCKIDRREGGGEGVILQTHLIYPRSW